MERNDWGRVTSFTTESLDRMEMVNLKVVTCLRFLFKNNREAVQAALAQASRHWSRMLKEQNKTPTECALKLQTIRPKCATYALSTSDQIDFP